MPTRLRPLFPALILLAAFLLLWLLLFSLREPTWDAVSYYTYARSVVFDGDLDLANDYQLSYPTAGEHFASKQLDQVTTDSGRVANLFAIGSALLWLPWLALLRLLAAAGLEPALLSSGVAGYQRFFTGNVAIFSALLGLCAFYLAYLVARQISDRTAALWAAVTLMVATPLLYYQFREPLYSHTASAFAVALGVFVWWRGRAGAANPWQGIALGAALGLAGLVRWQNLAYLLLPVVSTAVSWWRLPAAQRRSRWRANLAYLLLVGFAALAVFSLQMAVWRLLYGAWLTVPQGESFVDWRAPYLLPLFFSSFRGLLPWMPVFFLALVGLVVLARRAPAQGLPLLVMLLVALYVNGATRDWFAGGGFGPRRLTSELALLLIGYTAFLGLIPRRARGWAAAILGLVLTLHQWLLLRFALPASLGGRVMSMAPTFRWEDVPLSRFATDLLSYAPQLWRQPQDVFVLPSSPLHQLLEQGIWPLQHFLVLLMTAVFLLAVLLVWWLLGPWLRGRPYLLVGAGVALLILANLWILLGA